MNYKFSAWDKEANIMIYSDHRTRKLYDVYYGFEMNGQGEVIDGTFVKAEDIGKVRKDSEDIGKMECSLGG